MIFLDCCLISECSKKEVEVEEVEEKRKERKTIKVGKVKPHHYHLCTLFYN